MNSKLPKLLLPGQFNRCPPKSRQLQNIFIVTITVIVVQASYDKGVKFIAKPQQGGEFVQQRVTVNISKMEK